MGRRLHGDLVTLKEGRLKELTGDEKRAEQRMEITRTGGPSVLRQVSSDSITQSFGCVTAAYGISFWKTEAAETEETESATNCQRE